jgi:RuvB-like protein 2
MAAALVCYKRKAAKVALQDVSRVYELFVDVKRSTQFLREYDEHMLRPALSEPQAMQI